MKKLFAVPPHTNGVNLWLLVLRICVAGFMLTHGFGKLENLMQGNFKFGDPLGIGSLPSLVLVVFAEFFCSLLIGLGLATRLACIPLIITMGVAAFITKSGSGFSGKELPLLYLLIYFTILFLGPGRYSVDKLIGGGKRR